MESTFLLQHFNSSFQYLLPEVVPYFIHGKVASFLILKYANMFNFPVVFDWKKNQIALSFHNMENNFIYSSMGKENKNIWLK